MDNRIISFFRLDLQNPSHRSVSLVEMFVLVLLVGCLPIIGSRSIGGSLGNSVGISSSTGSVVTFDPSLDEDQTIGRNQDAINSSSSDSDGISSSSSSPLDNGNDIQYISNSNTNPCALVSLSLLDGGRNFQPYEEKSLVRVAHHVFDVAHGIVPNIVYKVDLEILPGQEFSLEYWINGVPDESRSRLKRRHQRDRRDILELYLNSSSSSKADIHRDEELNFCSKSSLGGQNKDSSSQVHSFNWFVNGNNLLEPSSDSNIGLPSNVIFRLRFRSILSKESTVFEQTLSVIIRPDCFLVLRVQDGRKLTLSSLLNSQMDNKGLNCTISLIPKTNFGLEIRLVNFSIYGMRGICKGRYLLIKPKVSKHNENNFEPQKAADLYSSEFPSQVPSPLLSSPDRKLCGKLEDYSVEERLLSFSPESPAPLELDKSWPEESNPTTGNVLLKVILPGIVKARESFTLELSSLSPCQKVLLKDLDGELKYSKNYEADECSIVIHVPYGNTIITKLTLSRFKAVGVGVSESTIDPEPRGVILDEQGQRNNGINEDNDSNSNNRYNNANGSGNGNSSVVNYYTDNESELELAESEEVMDNLVNSPKSYECPVSGSDPFQTGSTSGKNYGGKGDEDNSIDGRSSFRGDRKHLLITAKDLVSGAEFTWCFDAGKDSQAGHKRAWKSSGNRVMISFKLKYFDVFHLTYQAGEVASVVGDCDRGWVMVDRGCVSLVERVSDWTAAEESCQFKGGHLASINNERDEHRIQKIITESALFHPSRAYWIGANDRESEGNFQWTSGLPFSYKNWFTGWAHKRNEIINSQPNDDGWSGQDCVEIREIILPTGALHSDAFLSMFGSSSTGGGKASSSEYQGSKHPSRFYWNDRNCEIKNFFLCETTTQPSEDFSCNRTLQLGSTEADPITITSPAYPNSYPDNTICIVTVQAPQGYRIILNFDEFVLEESPSCQYDALEISEHPAAAATLVGTGSSDGTAPEGKNLTGGGKKSKKLCGDWTKKLKLLRYSTASSASVLSLKFESDFSHHFPGFKANVLMEKDVSEQCKDLQMKKFGSYCYLGVSFPAVNWATAQQICVAQQGKLASILSLDEWNFLSTSITGHSSYDKRSMFWIGGFIDQNNQLVWSDRMPYNFSAIHTADMQIMSDWKCLRAYWYEGGRGSFAWKLADCNQHSGYICKTKVQGETRKVVNQKFSGTGGKQNSPNYPSNYSSNLDYTYQLVAPRGTQIVIRFSHMDVEEQEDCLYDFLEINDRTSKNSTRYCGTYAGNELSKLDYISSSNEVYLLFHTDFSNTRTGFEIVWRAVDVTSCVSGKTIMTELVGNGFPLLDASIHSPNFPYFNLPHLNCVYTIVAPVGQRIFLSFQVFEFGRSRDFPDEEACLDQDHVSIDLGGSSGSGDMYELSTTADTSVILSNDNEIILCGNLTTTSFRTSLISSQEKIRIRVFSPMGKSGRGFLARFKAVPFELSESLTVATKANTSMIFSSLNFPLDPPEKTNLTVALSSPPNYVLIVNINATTNCPKTIKSFLEIRDPYHGANGTTWRLCKMDEIRSNNLPENVFRVANDDRGSNGRNDIGGKKGRSRNDNDISLGIPWRINSVISFRSTFNRLDIRQIYLNGFTGKKWTAVVSTSVDENFREKVLADGDRLLRLDGCINSPCANGGTCESDRGKHICRCPAPFTGPFCGLSLCDLNPCLFGECILGEKSIKCVCQLGYGGERCDRRMKPCDDSPCSGHGDCLEVNSTSYKCMCHAWWEGPQCESRMLIIPYKPLSQRMIEEPFWLGLITVTVVLGVIGLIWCLKRHFPEKLEKLLNEELDQTRGISWVSGRSPSFRAGGGVPVGVREPIPGTSQQSVSPPVARSFLGRFGIRKPSLLSLSSATSNVSVTAASPHTYENRTFSLDDLLRPYRSMMRTPSPHRRRNYSVQVRRDPAEKQQILQQLVSAGGSTSLDGESKPSTPKPTLAEIIQMSEKRLRLASASSIQGDYGVGNGSTGVEASSSYTNNPHELETSFTTSVCPSAATAAAIKAEKKVTFARMLDKLAATEMTSSSSCSDVSCAEETKIVVVHPKPQTKKDRKGRFRRSKAYHRGRNSETDQDCMDISSSDTTPDPIYTPRFPTRLCISPTNLSSSPTNSSNTLSTVTIAKGGGAKIAKIGSADSLLALFRRFSGGSNSAPPSPQYSENEESSAGATPLSTPSSPRNSLLSIRPPAFLITSAPELNNTIELPVIDPFAQSQVWNRTSPSSSITLEVPMRDYCLSPIHEVPTPLGTPSHSPCHTPMMKRPSGEYVPRIKIQLSSEDDDILRRNDSKETPPPRKLKIPMISISVDEGDTFQCSDSNENDPEEEEGFDPFDYSDRSEQEQLCGPGESEVIPDVLIHVPPDACLESQPDLDSPCSGSGRGFGMFKFNKIKPKPPPLIFANDMLSLTGTKGGGGDEHHDDDKNVNVIVPIVSIEYATPVAEYLPGFPDAYLGDPKSHYIPLIMPKTTVHSKERPIMPPMITINVGSEIESDSDPPTQRHLHHRPNICFLSPFAGTSDRVPSESNLSTSGYSSMASPCPSRCPSVSPLCSSEVDDYNSCSHGQCQPRRASLTPGTPKKPLSAPRRSSLNMPVIASGLLSDNSNMPINEYYDQELGKCAEIETDSAVEIETDVDCLANMSEVENPPLTPLERNPNISIISEEMNYINSLLQVPKKGMPKSRSLDAQFLPDGTQLFDTAGKGYLAEGSGRLDKSWYLRGLGPSLDSKLNSIGPSGNNSVTIIFPLSSPVYGMKSSGNLIEIPEEKDRKLSPVSSRSESPLSELSAAGFSILGSPLTDSDGVYDCGGSSEVLGNNNETDNSNKRANLAPLHRLHPQRRSLGRKKGRKMTTPSHSLSKLSPEYVKVPLEVGVQFQRATTSSLDSKRLPRTSPSSPTGFEFPVSDSPKEAVIPSISISKRSSPKRRVRAQPAVEGTSSSSESASSCRPRSRASLSSNQTSRDPSRNSSPLPSTHGYKFEDVRPLKPYTSSSQSSSSVGGIGTHPSIALVEGFNEANPVNSTSALEEEQVFEGKDYQVASTSATPSLPIKIPNTLPCSPARKISKLRTISHQIRFLRRLELSLISKKECLTQVSPCRLGEDRREAILGRTDSTEDSSRYDTSDSGSVCSECSSASSINMNTEKPLLGASSSSTNTTTGTSSSGERRLRKKGKETMTLLENITATDFFKSCKSRNRKNK